MNKIQVYQTNLFRKQKKKLKNNQIKELDKAIKRLLKDPKIGEKKKGELSSVWVYKFSMVNQRYLLAYKWDEKSRTLIAIDVHENFYREVKKSLKKSDK